MANKLVNKDIAYEEKQIIAEYEFRLNLINQEKKNIKLQKRKLEEARV